MKNKTSFLLILFSCAGVLFTPQKSSGHCKDHPCCSPQTGNVKKISRENKDPVISLFEPFVLII